LTKKDEVDAEVLWEDQQKINMFSQLNTLSHELDEKITVHKV
jgi:hypothetical protein